MKCFRLEIPFDGVSWSSFWGPVKKNRLMTEPTRTGLKKGAKEEKKYSWLRINETKVFQGITMVHDYPASWQPTKNSALGPTHWRNFVYGLEASFWGACLWRPEYRISPICLRYVSDITILPSAPRKKKEASVEISVEWDTSGGAVLIRNRPHSLGGLFLWDDGISVQSNDVNGTKQLSRREPWECPEAGHKAEKGTRPTIIFTGHHILGCSKTSQS